MFEALRRNYAERNYAPLGLELLVVIFGILIAFQVERWAEERRERGQEYEYLVRLKEDLQIEIDHMDEAYAYAQSRIDAAMLLEEIAANPSVAGDQPEALPSALETASWRSFPQIDAFVYSELQSSGNLALIRSVSLRRDLAKHYTSIRNYSRVGLDLEIQHQFERLTAGMLTSGELRAIEDESWHGTSHNISAERAADIADELVRRQGAIDLLPNMIQHHVFNQKVIEIIRDQTMKIIDQIDLLIEDFDK
jgi:hypothetical protein